MLVVDASVVVGAILAGNGFGLWREHQLLAPPLLWSEVRSVLHEHRWRGLIPGDQVAAVLERFETIPVERREDVQLGDVAWSIADEMGWAKTYDAEYIALARLLDCRMVTADARLRRSAKRLGRIVGPTEV